MLQLGDVLQQQMYALFSLQRPAKALQALQRAIDIYEPLQRRQPDDLRYIDTLGALRQQEHYLRTTLGDAAGVTAAEKEIQRLETARAKARIPALEKEISVRAKHVDLVNKIGGLMYDRKYAEALPVLSVIEDLSRRTIILAPADFSSYSGIGQYYRNTAEAQKALGNAAGELGNLAAAMNAAQVAAWLAPAEQRELRNLILLDARLQVATALFERKRTGEALPIVRESIVLAEEMAERRECIDCRWHLGVAKCLFASGQDDVSADGLRSGIIHIESAAKESRNGKITSDLGRWRLALAAVLEKSGSKREAGQQRRLALEAYRQSDKTMPTEAAKAAIARIEKLIGPG